MKILWILPLCLCLAITAYGNLGNTKKKLELTGMSSIEETYSIRPLGPVREPTHENLVQDTHSLLVSAQDSFERMNAAASEKGEVAVSIAQNARKACEQRLGELVEMDLDALSNEELLDLMLELSDTLTTLREARDAIDDLP